MRSVHPSSWNRWLTQTRRLTVEAPTTLARIVHPVPVLRLDRAMAFYASALGFSTQQHVPHCLALMRHSGADICLMPNTQEAFEPVVRRICTRGMMHWLPALESRLRHAGYRAPSLVLQPWDALELTLRDSEGNTLIWIQTLDEDGQP